MSIKQKEVQKSLDELPVKDQLSQAIQLEDRVRFHTESYAGNNGVDNFYLHDYFNWIGTLIPEDKLRLYKSMFRFPSESCTLSDKVFDIYEKIFDGQDASFNYDFNSKETKQNALSFLEEIEFRYNWRKDSMRKFRTGHNSLVVIDLPQEQKNDQPNPYYFFLDIRSVIHVQTSKNCIDWLVFRINDETIAVLDDTSYRLFQVDDAQITKLLFEKEHGLGYTPCCWLVDDLIDERTPIIRRSPITAYLTQYDKYLLFTVSKQVFDLYGPYPIIWVFSEDCEYMQESTRGDEYTRIECRGGYLVNESGVSLLDGSKLKECPECARRRITGAGGILEVEPPSGMNEKTNLREPVGIVEIGTGQLNYNVEEVERRKTEILKGLTGNDIDFITEAVNKTQMVGSFESRKSILLKIKIGFEKVENFVTKTMLRLRFNEKLNVSISYGSEFYLYDADTILKNYTDRRASKLDVATLDYLHDQYTSTRFKNNNYALKRSLIVNNLDPLRHVTLEEAIKLQGLDVISLEDLQVKANLSSLIARFEREQISIVEYGEDLTFEAKIKDIKKTIKTYLHEKSNQDPSSDSEAGANSTQV